MDATASGPVLEVTDLGTLEGESGSSQAWAVNERGDVAGKSSVSGEWHAFLWPDGVMRDIGRLGRTGGSTEAINARGEVVGSTIDDAGGAYAFVWRAGTMQTLPHPAELWRTAAHAINDHGVIVGECAGGPEYAPDRPHACMWDDSGVHDLGTGAGDFGAGAIARGINNRGQVVGEMFSADYQAHAFRWENGRFEDLGTVADAVSASAQGISDRGDILVNVNYVDGWRRPFVWSRGEWTGILPEDRVPDAHGWAIDSKGEVTGFLTRYHPFLWRRDVGIVELDGTGLINALAVSNGVVAGYLKSGHAGIVRVR